MNRLGLFKVGIAVSMIVFGGGGAALAQDADMTFLVTSVGKGEGANLGAGW